MVEIVDSPSLASAAQCEPVSTSLPTPRTLARKLAEVMVALERVPKNGKVQTEKGSYSVATAADIFDAVRKELGQRKIIIIPRPQSHDVTIETDKTVSEIVFTYELVDAESGESFFIEDVPVRIVDSSKSDKGLQKAFTVGVKTVLCTLLLVSTGGDDDGANRGGQTQSGRQSSQGGEKKEQRREVFGELVEANATPGAKGEFLWVSFRTGGKDETYICNEKSVVEQLKGAGPMLKCGLQLFKRDNWKNWQVVGIKSASTGGKQ